MKKIISLILSVTLLLSILSVSFVSKAADVAKIGSTYYATLEDAISSASDGDTVVLIADAGVSAPITVSSDITLSSEGSHSVYRTSANSSYLFSVSGGLTIASGVTLDGKGISATASMIDVGGSLTLCDGASLIGNSNSTSGGSAVTVSGGVFDFIGGSITSNTCAGNGNAVYVTSSAGTLRMGGAATISSGSDILLSDGCYIEITAPLYGSGSIPIVMPNASVGTVIASGVGNVSDAQLARFSVSNGTVKFAVGASGDSIVCGLPSENTDCVKVGDNVYKTVNEAVNSVSANSEATLSIIADCGIFEQVNITDGRKINITSDKEVSIFRANASGDMFSVASGASLSVSSSSKLTLSGSSVGADGSCVSVKGTFNLGNGVVLTGNASNKNGGAVSVNGGSFNMNGGIIYYNSAYMGGGIYLGSGSANLSAGTIYDNGAALGGGIYYAGGTLNLSGNCSIYSSVAFANDIYLAQNQVIKVGSWTPVGAPSGYTNAATLTPAAIVANTILATFDGAAKKDHFILTSAISTTVYALLCKDSNLILAPANEAYCAFYNGVGYATINEAVEATGYGESVIEIINDTAVANKILIPQGKSIILYAAQNPYNNDEYTTRRITRTSDNTYSVFYVEAGASLSLGAPDTKALILDGENVPCDESGILSVGELNLSAGSSIIGFNNITNEVAPYGVTYGGAVFLAEKAVLNINGGIIENCYATYGGAIFNLDSTVNFNSGSIKNCSALNGGGIYLLTSETVTDGVMPANLSMIGGDFTANSAVEKDGFAGTGVGGALYIENGSVVAMSAGSITDSKGTKGSAVAVGNPQILLDEQADEAKFIISNDALISKTDTVYIGTINVSCITVAGSLKLQSDPITIQIPDSLVQNMKLVKYQMSDNAKDNENAAAADCAAGKFVLEEAVSKLFVLATSKGDGSVIVNANPENNFGGYLSGKHYNGIEQYTSEVIKNDDGTEQKQEAVYNSISVPSLGSFSATFEMSYYANLYNGEETYITAPFMKGTNITLIDSSNSQSVGYYYYTVTGEETKTSESQKVEGSEFVTPAYIEIPLSAFYKMGSTTEKYTPVDVQTLKADENSNKTLHEKMTFVVDFSATDNQSHYVNQGEFTMSWNHYIKGAIDGIRYDISDNFKKVIYKAVALPDNRLNVNCESGECEISYLLDEASNSVCDNNGVILIKLDSGKYQTGTYFEDEIGNQYPAQNKSDTVYVQLPKDTSGKVMSSASRKLTLKNYFGRDITPVQITVSILASNNGTHKQVGDKLDCTTLSIAFTPKADAQSAVSVTNLEGTERAYFPSLKDLKNEDGISMNVKATEAKEEAYTFTLSMQKKNESGKFEDCDIDELFTSGGSAIGKKAEIATGAITLKFNSDFLLHQDSEYRLKFTVGNSVEYVKINDNK